MTRTEATSQILQAKQERGLTFEQIAKAVGRHQVWTTAALLGQAPMSKEEAQEPRTAWAWVQEIRQALEQIPMRGSLETPVPVDPLIYRFHEITQVYATTLKALINEMFGDGIMSAIDFSMEIERVTDHMVTE